MRELKLVVALVLFNFLSGCAYRLDMTDAEYKSLQRQKALYSALELEQRLLQLKTDSETRTKHLESVKTYGKQKFSSTKCRR